MKTSDFCLDANIARLSNIPENLTMQASYGGADDALIHQHGLKFARVFPSARAALASGPAD